MYQKILVPLDGSSLAECVLPHLDTIAKGCGVKELTLVRVVEPLRIPAAAEGYAFTEEDLKKFDSAARDEARSYLQQIARKVNYDGVDVQTKVISGRPADKIAEFAKKNEVDLIIIATHGRSGVSRWVWGSVADKVLRSACSPVLMIRAPGCVPGI